MLAAAHDHWAGEGDGGEDECLDRVVVESGKDDDMVRLVVNLVNSAVEGGMVKQAVQEIEEEVFAEEVEDVHEEVPPDRRNGICSDVSSREVSENRQPEGKNVPAVDHHIFD